jgi:phosphate transport system substrate-binding protein
VSDTAVEQEQVSDFVDFYIENIDEIVTEAQYVPLTDEQKSELTDAFGQLTS